MVDTGVSPESLMYSDGELLQKVLDIVKKEKLVGKLDERHKVVDFRHPEELSVSMSLKLEKETWLPIGQQNLVCTSNIL